jgi:RNA polymerase sigma factor (sigma-70 family)
MRYKPSCTNPVQHSADDNDGQLLLSSLTAHKPLLARSVRWAKSAGLLRYRHQNEDAWQAACLGFIQAYRRYDAKRGVPVGSFARGHVVGTVREALGAYIVEDRNVAIDKVRDETGEDVLRLEADASSRAEAMEVAAAIRKFVADLSPRQRFIVKEVFWADRSQADVARELGVTRQAVTMTLETVYARGRNALVEYQAA